MRRPTCATTTHLCHSATITLRRLRPVSTAIRTSVPLPLQPPHRRRRQPSSTPRPAVQEAGISSYCIPADVDGATSNAGLTVLLGLVIRRQNECKLGITVRHCSVPSWHLIQMKEMKNGPTVMGRDPGISLGSAVLYTPEWKTKRPL